MNKLNIPIIVGNKREKRMTIHAAKLVHEVAKEYEEIELILVEQRCVKKKSQLTKKNHFFE